nr:hypothetical protein [Spiroplasma taiwanense]
MNFHFQHYNEKEIEKIIKINSLKLNILLENDVISFISKYCQNNPRVSINILRRIYDFIIFENISNININFIKKIKNIWLWIKFTRSRIFKNFK